MKTTPRTEWNGLPGYLASQRLPGTSVESDLKLLDLGFDADTVREFIKDPIKAIRRKFENKNNLEEANKGEDLLIELVIKMMLIGVCAERERVAEEERRRERSA